eukprot:m.59491 g.59491  ORF g.59491 m.59491 type:complete len:545 (+) comp11252_c0_seq3:225-1859(+)
MQLESVCTSIRFAAIPTILVALLCFLYYSDVGEFVHSSEGTSKPKEITLWGVTFIEVLHPTLPKSSMRCFGGKEEPNSKPRTCIFENLYFKTSQADDQFLFLLSKEDASKEENRNASLPCKGPGGGPISPNCMSCSGGTYNITPVWNLQQNTSKELTTWQIKDSLLHGSKQLFSVVDLPTQFNFAHYFLEWGLDLAWIRAKFFNSWNYSASKVTTIVSGTRLQTAMSLHRSDVIALSTICMEENGSSDNKSCGHARFVRNIMEYSGNHPALFANEEEEIHVLPTDGYLLLPKVVIGGTEGMSIWQKHTYTEPRKPTPYDYLYPPEMRAAALSLYTRRILSRNYLELRREQPDYDQIDEEKNYIFIMNRRRDPSHARGLVRTVNNIESLFKAAQAEWGKRLYKRVIDFEEVVGSVNTTVALFRKARLLIAPHGANLCNIVFLPPGSALLELAVEGHKHHVMMFETLATAVNVEYTASYCGGHHWGNGPINANIKDVMKKGNDLLTRTEPEARRDHYSKQDALLKNHVSNSEMFEMGEEDKQCFNS